jgi:hypothetical protein
MDPSVLDPQLPLQDPPSLFIYENATLAPPEQPPAPIRQPHVSVLGPIINGVRPPTSTKAVSRRPDIGKQGPKPMPLLKRKASWVEPEYVVQKTKQFRPREKKIIVIMYWHCYRIEEWSWELNRMVWRKPYYKEIKQKFPTLVESTIGNWIRAQEKILNAPKGLRIIRDYWLLYWPETEEELVKRFRARRAENKLAGYYWLIKNTTQIFREVYSEYPTAFTFSYGWLQGFLRRNNIFWRRII